MTAQTRELILASMHCSPAAPCTDQEAMDAYLFRWRTRDRYESEACQQPEFYAVLATAEYHKHWQRANQPKTQEVAQ